MTDATDAADAYEFITYESLDDGQIVRIRLNRPDQRNAQNRGLLVELDAAFKRAEEDDVVRVVILGAVGSMFSTGHDLGSARALEENQPGPGQHPTRVMNGGTRPTVEKRMLQEWHYFFSNTLRWRNLRKITVAEVHGKVLAAGLMLMWACDLIVAADDTIFADVVGTRLGMCGVEYFAHPWEFGPRKTKELMLTGDAIDADEAWRLGFVSKVFRADELEAKTLAFCRRIAKLPTVTALLIKESVNQTVDNMGFSNALNASFSLHQLNHAYWTDVSGGKQATGSPEYGLADWRAHSTIRVARRDTVGDEDD
jgi:enoyl-CoA hydratase